MNQALQRRTERSDGLPSVGRQGRGEGVGLFESQHQVSKTDRDNSLGHVWQHGRHTLGGGEGEKEEDESEDD